MSILAIQVYRKSHEEDFRRKVINRFVSSKLDTVLMGFLMRGHMYEYTADRYYFHPKYHVSWKTIIFILRMYKSFDRIYIYNIWYIYIYTCEMVVLQRLYILPSL